MTFVIVIRCKDQGLVNAQKIMEGLPMFGNLGEDFTLLVGHGQGGLNTSGQRFEFDILAYEFTMDDDEFLYFRDQIEKTKLNDCVSYFQRDIFNNLHQLT